jgi:hypothetical protein
MALNLLQKIERRRAYLQKYVPKPALKPKQKEKKESPDKLAVTRFDPCLWIKQRFGVDLWAGTDEKPGQREIANAYALSLHRQWERREFEAGRIVEQQLENYVPGTQVKNIIRVEAGHT